jgi:nicotinate-nucleotide pyrophosphorylase (carboxylating)
MLILFDNMTNDQMAEGVRLCKGRALTEASGGITIDTVRGIAEAGVDLISSGALTHSVKALDISLEVRPAGA